MGCEHQAKTNTAIMRIFSDAVAEGNAAVDVPAVMAAAAEPSILPGAACGSAIARH